MGSSWQRCRTHYAANLMSVTPKSSWPWVKALLHSVYDQPDAGSVQRYACFRDAMAYVRSRGDRYPDGLNIEPQWTQEVMADVNLLALEPDPKSHMAPRGSSAAPDPPGECWS